MTTQPRLKVCNVLLSAMTLLGIGLSSTTVFNLAALAGVPGNVTFSPDPNAPGGTGTMMNPNPPQPPPHLPLTAHPSTIEHYTFSYRLNSILPIVYIGTGYTRAGSYTIGQVISVAGLTGMVNATVTSVDDTIPFDEQLLNSPVTVTQQYQTNLPQYQYGSSIRRSGSFLK